MKLVVLTIFLIVQNGLCFFQVFTNKDWTSFKLKHEKTYPNLFEEKIRVGIFLKNLEIITKHNINYSLGKVSYEMGVNQFSDMHPHEVLGSFTGEMVDENNFDGTFNDYVPLSKDVNVPESMDWRLFGAVTAVKNQGKCGSCWTFATTGAIEGQLFLKTKNRTPLSEQNLLDCAETNYSNNGCHGGLAMNTFKYVHDYGIESEKSYPYTSVRGNCRFDKQKSVTKTKGYVKLPSNDEESLKKAVASVGPIAVSILVTNSFPNYKSGVFYDSTCDYHTNHAVLVVGYGTEMNQDYWLVKNSWGPRWGINGYIKMARNKNSNCNIALRGVYPTL